MTINPYPQTWHRRLDFLPPLGLQVAVGDADLNLFYCYTSVSIQESSAPRMPKEARTEYGTLKINPEYRNQVDYEMGTPNPRLNLHPIPQKELLDDIRNHLGGAIVVIGDIPDVVIKARGIVEKIPPQFEEYKAFQGSGNIFSYQESKGNFVHKVREALGMRAITNPYRFMKYDLMNRGLIKSSLDPILRKLRSTLKTVYVIPEASGWSDLGDAGVLVLEKDLIAKRWWTDIGQPVSFEISYNHMGVRGQVYRLLRRNCLVVV